MLEKPQTDLSPLQGLVSFNFGIASTNKRYQLFRYIIGAVVRSKGAVVRSSNLCKIHPNIARSCQKQKVFDKKDLVTINGVKMMVNATKTVQDIDSLSVNLHDAVVLFAHGLNKSISRAAQECHINKDDISEVTFEGAISSISIDANGDVLNPDTLVLNIQENPGMINYELVEVGEVSNNTFKEVDGVQIMWPGTRTDPINDCGDEMELCPPEEKDASHS
eukprot:sb/3469834/